jgi:hypothetical protein
VENPSQIARDCNQVGKEASGQLGFEGAAFGKGAVVLAAVLVLVTNLFALAADFSDHSGPESPRAKVIFDHASGFYDAAFRLILSSPVPEAVIYYTTNGTIPRPATGLRYTDGIAIHTTTLVCAIVFDGNTPLTQIETRTFLFISAILQQTGGWFPPNWGTNAGQGIPAHYRLSSPLVNDPASRQTLIQGFHAIPSLSIVTDPENLFSSQTGIYLHPLERGADWERAVTVDWIDPRGRSGFQINCGLRIHGGMSRRPEESPKHSFRLAFKRRYGAGKLRFPLFGPEGAQEFDDLVLRAGSNDSWLNSNGDQRRQATYLRDEWTRRSMLALGHPSARGRFVHLYLNGLYWGVYNLCERPAESMLANGKTSPPTRYDVRKADQIESGDQVAWDTMMTLANSGLDKERSYQEISQCLDLTEFVDFLLLNFFAGNSDWDRSANWYAIRPRIPRGKFQFLVWDADRTLTNPEVNMLGVDDEESPMHLFHQLSQNARFRELFAARAQHVLFGNGPLAPGPAAERFRILADSVTPALVAEAARWGNYRATVHRYQTGPYDSYTIQNHWQPEVNRVLSDYFPERREILLQQLRERGLFGQGNISRDTPAVK